MKNEIMKLLQSYNVTAEAYNEIPADNNARCRVVIETGSNEGYYVVIQRDGREVSCRYHSKDEAMTALGVLLTLVPNQ